MSVITALKSRRERADALTIQIANKISDKRDSTRPRKLKLRGLIFMKQREKDKNMGEGIVGGMFADKQIRMALDSGLVKIRPEPTEELIQPASIDIRLGGGGLMRYKTNWPDRSGPPLIIPGQDQSGNMEHVPFDEKGCLVLEPGDFRLGTTVEEVELPDNIAGRVEGKSSLARAGLIPHAAAGFIDPGFRGRITLEISNLAPLPILLCRGMKIGQIAFIPMGASAERPYGSPGLGSKYQGQMEVTPARSAESMP